MQKKTLKRILGYVRPYTPLVVLSLLCAGLSAGAQLLIPIFTGDVLDLLIGPGQVQWSRLPALLLYIAVAAILWHEDVARHTDGFCTFKKQKNKNKN